jgi:membrane protein implicated in regulation of membrane protease activity
MNALLDLYVQSPFWIWLGVGAVFVALDIASGSGKLIWPGAAAAVLAFLNLADIRLGLEWELGVLFAVSILGIGLTSNIHLRRPDASPDRLPTVEKPTLPSAESLDLTSRERSARLIGRIGRTTGEFANGVGRVWIDGAEWGAEIDAGDDVLPSDVPVRVMGVTGGVRLQVRGLS